MEWLLFAWPTGVALTLIGGGLLLRLAADGPRYRGVHESAPVRVRHRYEDLHTPTIVVNRDHYHVRRRAR